MLKPDTSVNTQPYQKETEFYYKKQIVKYKNYDKNSPEDLNGYLKENEDHTYLKRKGKYCRVSYLNHFRTNRSVTAGHHYVLLLQGKILNKANQK